MTNEAPLIDWLDDIDDRASTGELMGQLVTLSENDFIVYTVALHVELRKASAIIRKLWGANEKHCHWPKGNLPEHSYDVDCESCRQKHPGDISRQARKEVLEMMK